MKFITELHNKHKSQPVWIAGSDPSLDGYPDNFLDGKIAFALHLAYLKFPNTTYRYANEQDRIAWFKQNRPEYFDKVNIFAFPFYKKTERQMNQLIDLEKPYFLILRPFPAQDVTVITKMVKDAKNGKRIDFGGHGSCLHACIYTAIMMGANPINIIGCNHESKDKLEHFKLGNDNNQYRNKSTPYATKGKIMKTGTELLIKACANNNIKINWFKNYEQTLHIN